MDGSRDKVLGNFWDRGVKAGTAGYVGHGEKCWHEVSNYQY